MKARGPQGVGHFCEVTRTLSEICEPVIWRPIRGGGWFSDMQFELFCRRPAAASAEE